MGGEWTERDALGCAIHLLNNRRQIFMFEADRKGLTHAYLEELDEGFAVLTSAVNHLQRRIQDLPRDVFGRGAAC